MESVNEFEREKLLNRLLVTLIITLLVIGTVLFFLLAEGDWDTVRLKLVGLYYVIPFIWGMMIFIILYFKWRIKNLTAKERMKDKELENKIQWENEILRLARERQEMDLQRQEAELMLKQKAKELGL